MSASWQRVLGLMIASASLVAGCSSAKKIDTGGACVLNSDCNQGLVCTWGKCHVACHTSADCQPGQSCITASAQSTVCESPTACIYNSDCPTGLMCATDQQCRQQCQKDVDCTSGQICTSTQTCAEPNQVDSNKNLITDGGVSGSGGASGAGGTGEAGGDAGAPDTSGAQPDAPFGGLDSGVDLVTAASDVGASEVDAAPAPIDAPEAAANLVASPETLALGTVARGQSSKEGHIIISNQGQQSSGVITFHTDNTEFVIQDPASGDCISGTTVLSAGANCTVWVTLTPVATGARTGMFTFQATPGGSGTVNLQGTGSCATDTLPDAQGQCVPMAGVVWQQRGTQDVWYGVASSADGSKLIAAATGAMYGGKLYISGDSGATWTLTGTSVGVQDWWSVASSADGRTLVAVSGVVFTSGDFGATWTQTTAPSQFWWSVASSADGTKLVAAANGGGVIGGGVGDAYIYTSGDSGATWTETGSLQAWRSVASSYDGTKLVAVADDQVHGGYIFTSGDSGATWTQATAPQKAWRSVASSYDGTKLVAVAYGSNAYTSGDSGTTWTEQIGSVQSWQSVASSSDGTKLVAVAGGLGMGNSGYIYTSIDSGATWKQRGFSQNWTSVASSADGTKLVAVVDDGYIYTSAGPVP